MHGGASVIVVAAAAMLVSPLLRASEGPAQGSVAAAAVDVVELPSSSHSYAVVDIEADAQPNRGRLVKLGQTTATCGEFENF